MIHAALSDRVLETLRSRAEEALATEGVEPTCLGYNVPVKLSLDELLEQERYEWPSRMISHLSRERR
jgi:hypothetical protein